MTRIANATYIVRIIALTRERKGIQFVPDPDSGDFSEEMTTAMPSGYR